MFGEAHIKPGPLGYKRLAKDELTNNSLVTRLRATKVRTYLGFSLTVHTLLIQSHIHIEKR